MARQARQARQVQVAESPAPVAAPAHSEAQAQGRQERVHALMLTAVAQAAAVEAGMIGLRKTRGDGVYTVLTLCAATDAQSFAAQWDRVKADMAANVGECATAAGLKKSAKTGAYKIPSSASSAASTLSAAIEWGITLVSVADNAPLAFTKIREAVNDERAVRQEQGADASEKVLYAARAALAVLVGQVTQLATAPLVAGETRVSDRLDAVMLDCLVTITDAAADFRAAHAPAHEE